MGIIILFNKVQDRSFTVMPESHASSSLPNPAIARLLRSHNYWQTGTQKKKKEKKERKEKKKENHCHLAQMLIKI